MGPQLYYNQDSHGHGKLLKLMQNEDIMESHEMSWQTCIL